MFKLGMLLLITAYLLIGAAVVAVIYEWRLLVVGLALTALVLLILERPSRPRSRC